MKLFLTISFLLIYTITYSQTKYAPMDFYSFLLPYSTRSLSLGGAGTALNADASAINHNPARLSLINEKTNYSIDTYSLPTTSNKFISAKYVYNKGINSIGFAINGFAQGTIKQVSEAGGTRPITLPSEYKMSVADAIMLSDNSSIGININYINRTKLMYTNILGASGITGGIGFIKKTTLSTSTDNELLTGVSIENIGGKSIDGFYKPTVLSLGTSFMHGYNENTSTTLPFLFGIELSKLMIPSLPIYDSVGTIVKGRNPNDVTGGAIFTNLFDDPYKKNIQKWRIQLYSEMILIPELLVRTGYSYENTIVGNRNFFTVGVGYALVKDKDIYNLDLGLVIPTKSDLNNLYNNVFSISFKYKTGYKW